MRGFLLIFIAVSGLAFGGQLYKCKGPNGEITFTNIKCPEKTESEHYGSYTATPDAPATAEPSGGEAALPPLPAHPTAQQAVAGYECSVNGKSWIQAAPCPLTSTHVVHEGVWLDTGQSGTVDRKEQVPVNQQALSHDAMCDRIAARANTTEKGENDPSASYERNRLSGSIGCH